MPGIYIHIPFCKKACHYCDFHFSTSLDKKQEMLGAIVRELEIRSYGYTSRKIDTIYLGGGTPSLLSAADISFILNSIHRYYSLSAKMEITLEANPDDLDNKRISAFVSAGINRLSIGIQSFFDEDLHWMNRSHKADQAKRSVLAAAACGISNISADLIFGYPLLNMEKWKKNVETMLSLPVNHISAYSMTVEKKTVLDHQIRNGISPPMPEYTADAQYSWLMEEMQLHSWEQYEISNFAKNGYYSKHNSAYWKNISYLGIGPSAHGYNENKRYWNIANNALYISSLAKGRLHQEEETLTLHDRYNEYVMTGLRTMWGINIQKLEKEFGKAMRTYFEKEYLQLEKEGWIIKKDDTFTLSADGKGIADRIISRFFSVEK
jgi:oxygen-independent coproporphyrinogen-3 oxidase